MVLEIKHGVSCVEPVVPPPQLLLSRRGSSNFSQSLSRSCVCWFLILLGRIRVPGPYQVIPGWLEGAIADVLSEQTHVLASSPLLGNPSASLQGLCQSQCSSRKGK